MNRSQSFFAAPYDEMIREISRSPTARRAALIEQAVRNVLNVWDGKAAYTSWREHQLPLMALLHEPAIRSEFRRLEAENG